MTTVTKEDFLNHIKTFFTKESGMSIAKAKAKIKSELVIDKWGNTENERIKVGNVTLFYCNNSNYCGGLKNGYGKGWYISNGGFTGGSTVKLSNNL